MENKQNKIIMERINALRQEMKAAGVHYYLVTTADPHGSEYINDHYKEREYLSGFTGSRGDLLVGEEECLLWTDGRYFVQAEKELEGTGIMLMKERQKDVPTIEEYLRGHLGDGMRLGLYGLCTDASLGKRLEKILREKQGEIIYQRDLADAIYQNGSADDSIYGGIRPADSAAPVRVLDEKLTGESVMDKLCRVREKMAEEKADYLLLSKLEDQMWLFNLRGADIECNPVAYAFSLISGDSVEIYLKESQGEIMHVSGHQNVTAYLEKNGIARDMYDDFMKELPEKLKKAEEALGRKAKVMLDPEVVNYAVYQMVKESAELIEAKNPTEMMRAVKNPIEIANLKRIYRKDSAVLTKFIYYIKTHKEDGLTESEAARILDGYRAAIEEFLELSFPTISAYGENAAMMHYEAVQGKDAVIKPEGIYLVDSGGQYEGGTTDVTRSIVMGKITPEMKKHYTLAVTGMLRLQSAVFLQGCTGRNLDILAREALWREEMDYKCGTGHGVGYMLSVHEGPQNISWRQGRTKEAELEPGMLISDEPGVYIAGSHGIRIENILLCEKLGCNDDGQFLGFEPLTFVPIDLEGIDSAYMEKRDIELLNRYHALVYERLAEYLDEEERAWLMEQTRAI